MIPSAELTSIAAVQLVRNPLPSKNMIRRIFLSASRLSAGPPSVLVFVPGVACILVGLLILLLPELLIALVSGLFFLIGGVLLAAAWRLRRLNADRPAERQTW